MRHGKCIKKLNKPTDQRIALLRNLVLSLFMYDKIRTTHKRAMSAKRIAEKIITLAKEQTLNSRRKALKILPNEKIISKVFSQCLDKFKNKKSGYTRVVKLYLRKGDYTPISSLQFVE